jgi:hypothetical protein
VKPESLLDDYLSKLDFRQVLSMIVRPKMGQAPALATKELKAISLLVARQQRVDVILLNAAFGLAVGNVIKGLTMKEE